MPRSARLRRHLATLRRPSRPTGNGPGSPGQTGSAATEAPATLDAFLTAEADLGRTRQPALVSLRLRLAEGEVDALIFGLRLIMQRSDPVMERAAHTALLKVAASLPADMDGLAASDEVLAGPLIASAGPHFGIIRQALQAEEKLVLCYNDKSDTTTERTVWPVAIGLFASGELLAAWCELRGTFRHFRLDRMAAVQPTGQRYPRPRRFLLAEWRLLEGISGVG